MHQGKWNVQFRKLQTNREDDWETLIEAKTNKPFEFDSQEEAIGKTKGLGFKHIRAVEVTGD